LRSEAFGVRQQAAAFKGTLEKQAIGAVFESGSKLPHSDGVNPSSETISVSTLCGSASTTLELFSVEPFS
jgi:hypothetical protein